MTQESIDFVQLCEKETTDLFNKFINDEEFLTKKVKDIVSIMKAASRDAIEFENSGASKEEIQKAQAEFMASMTENQLVSMKEIHDELAPAKHERMKTMATMSLDEFKEVSFELSKKEMVIMGTFMQTLMQKAEGPIMEAMDEVEEEMTEKELKTETETPVFDINSGKTLIN